MIATAFSYFRPPLVAARTQARRPQTRGAPVFIGDAVHPWEGATLLLAILNRQASDEKDQS
jgi:hypothetical protein